MIILFTAILLHSNKPAQTYYLAGIETLLEVFMISALITTF